MKEKRLGRGLEEVSHLFLSSLGGDKAKGEKKAHKFICIGSGAPAVEKSFLVTNLAIYWAKSGKTVAILDGDNAAPSVGFLMGAKQEGAPQSESLSVLTTEYDVPIVPISSIENVYGNVPEIAQLYILHLPPYKLGQELPAGGDKFAVLVPASVAGMIDAYRLIKYLLLKHPELEVGVIAIGVNLAREAELVWEKMNEVCKRFLGKGVEFYGYLFDDLSVFESIWKREPVVLRECRATDCIANIARRLE